MRRPVSVRRRGFSLMEMLVAIGLVIALLAALFTFFWDMLAARERVVETTERARAVTTLLERVERDLMTAIVGDGAYGPGVRGDGTSVRILTRSVPVRFADRGRSAVEAFGDLEASEYRFDPAGKGLEARRDSVAPGADLRGAFFPLGGSIARVRFRYHDGSAWQDRFDSREAGRLPQAVEVAIWLDAPPGAAGLGDEYLRPDGPDAEDEGREPTAPDRLTFDGSAGFDERAFAEASDLMEFEEPRPDRVRVFAVPDAAAAPAGTESVGAGEP